jgi:hypothetical protein
MAPKAPASSLASVKPSKIEIEDARRVLAQGEKAQKSKMACMVAWLKNNPDAAASASRGDDRKRYLEAFLVQQMRAKGGIKTTSNEKTFQTRDDKKIDHHW